MAVRLNHTIVAARDKEASARFLAARGESRDGDGFSLRRAGDV
jgi:hypothetical protein